MKSFLILIVSLTTFAASAQNLKCTNSNVKLILQNPLSNTSDYVASYLYQSGPGWIGAECSVLKYTETSINMACGLEVEPNFFRKVAVINLARNEKEATFYGAVPNGRFSNGYENNGYSYGSEEKLKCVRSFDEI